MKKLRMPSRCRMRGTGWKRCPESVVLGSEFCRAHLPTKSFGSRDGSARSRAMSNSVTEEISVLLSTAAPSDASESAVRTR